MVRLIAILAVAVGVAGCDMIKSATNAFKYAEAAATELEAATGVKPVVGFNWNNGRLTDVTVTYPHLLEGKPLRELSETVRATVAKEFNQEPGRIVLSFVVQKPAPVSQQAPAQAAARQR